MLCQKLHLTHLTISTFLCYSGRSGYGDDGAHIVSRHLPLLWEFNTASCQLGWEGAVAISNGLTKLRKLDARDNPQIRRACVSLGRLHRLKELFLGNVGSVDWSAVTLARRFAGKISCF